MNDHYVSTNLSRHKWFETGLEVYRRSDTTSALPMSQILQNIKTDETIHAEVPVLLVRSGSLLFAIHASLVSAGRERILVDFGKSGWLQKARSQPEKVKAVIDKIKEDGLKPTL